jgi:hypothetical protein
MGNLLDYPVKRLRNLERDRLFDGHGHCPSSDETA